MTDKPISFIDDLDIDQEPEPEAGALLQPVHGLVVGARMTPAEYEVYAAEINRLSKAGQIPDVEFDDGDSE